MKSVPLLSSIALFAFAIADPLPLDRPSRVARDAAVVNSVIAQVSAAITQLDNSVKAFTGDTTKLQIDATSLINILNSGITSVGGSANLTLPDATGLQPLLTSLQTAGQSLVNDLGAKKTVFEQAGLCSPVESTITSISAGSSSLLDAIVAKVPAEAQGLAESVGSGLLSTLAQGVAAFSSGQCINSATSSSASAPVSSTVSATTALPSTTLSTLTAVPVTTVATEKPTGASSTEGGTVVVTVTVTASCPCSEKTTSGGPLTSTSTHTLTSTLTSTSIATVSVTSTRLSTSASTVRSNSTMIPTGGSTASSSLPITTAGAVANAVGPVGVIAGVFAVLML